MPNMRKLEEAAKKLAAEQKERSTKRNSIVLKEKTLTRLQRIQALFGTDGWLALTELLWEQKTAVLDIMEVAEPINDRDLHALRIELVQLAKLLTLDVDIANQVDLTQQELKALHAATAEGPGDK